MNQYIITYLMMNFNILIIRSFEPILMVVGIITVIDEIVIDTVLKSK
jgi:hypothetical protein